MGLRAEVGCMEFYDGKRLVGRVERGVKDR